MIDIVAGGKSGVGQYLKKYRSFVFDHDKDLAFLSRDKEPYNKKYDTVIYLINVANKDENDVVLNKEILQKYLELDFKHFIFFSSIDVISTNECLHGTQNVREFEKQEENYKKMKYECELLVEDVCKKRNLKSLILRPSMIINPYARPNSIEKIKTNDDIRISNKSEINCIGVHSIGKFLKYVLKNKLNGTYCLTSKYNTTIDKVIAHLDKNINCGEYIYKTTRIKENPIMDIEPSFNKSSLDVALDYINYGVY